MENNLVEKTITYDNNMAYVTNLYKDLDKNFETKKGNYLIEKNYIYISELSKFKMIDLESLKKLDDKLMIEYIELFYEEEGFSHWDLIEFCNINKVNEYLKIKTKIMEE